MTGMESSKAGQRQDQDRGAGIHARGQGNDRSCPDQAGVDMPEDTISASRASIPAPDP
jgi:hypothetical protein